MDIIIAYVVIHRFVGVLVFRRIRQIDVRLERVLSNQEERRARVDNADIVFSSATFCDPYVRLWSMPQ